MKVCSRPLVASLAACATSNPDVVQRGDAQRVSHVLDATVLSVRPVTIDGGQSGARRRRRRASPAASPAPTSAATATRLVAGVLGAVVGGIVGNAVERDATRQNGVEIILQLRNGQRRAIVQAVGSETIMPGDAGRARHDRRQDAGDPRAAAVDAGPAQLTRSSRGGAAGVRLRRVGAASRNATMLRVELYAS